MELDILRLIEAQALDALDAVQIRGHAEYGTPRAGEWSYTGYDYANQRWIEHTWQI